MPLVLTQHAADASRDLNRYLDREGLIYHFPAQYLPVLRKSIEEFGDRRFIYQRPTRGSTAVDAGRYFGCGLLGNPYEDVQNSGHYFTNVYQYAKFTPVPLRRSSGEYYETGTLVTPNFRGRSIRWIDAAVYFAILEAGRLYSASPQTDMLDLNDTGVFAPGRVPLDGFRLLTAVPAGTGYVPHSDEPPDPHEAAALHERARGDHQEMLRLILEQIHTLGGEGLYNNNVDLFARIGERRFLIEAKSLTRPFAAVDRMRYGMGQLLDYSVRYRADLQSAEPVLAFATPPDRDSAWISTILNENRIAFVARSEGRIRALNDLAETLPFSQ